jgi:transposase
MSKHLYTQSQIEELENNPHVLRASERSITYHPDFKIKAVMEYESGKSPSQIFIDNGFNLLLIGREQPRKIIHRWRKTITKYGGFGLIIERRGKGSTGRPSSSELSVEEKLKKAEARIKFLEAENDFLKKLEELERQAMNKKRF